MKYILPLVVGFFGYSALAAPSQTKLQCSLSVTEWTVDANREPLNLIGRIFEENKTVVSNQGDARTTVEVRAPRGVKFNMPTEGGYVLNGLGFEIDGYKTDFGRNPFLGTDRSYQRVQKYLSKKRSLFVSMSCRITEN